MIILYYTYEKADASTAMKCFHNEISSCQKEEEEEENYARLKYLGKIRKVHRSKFDEQQPIDFSTSSTKRYARKNRIRNSRAQCML